MIKVIDTVNEPAYLIGQKVSIKLAKPQPSKEVFRNNLTAMYVQKRSNVIFTYGQFH